MPRRRRRTGGVTFPAPVAGEPGGGTGAGRAPTLPRQRSRSQARTAPGTQRRRRQSDGQRRDRGQRGNRPTPQQRRRRQRRQDREALYNPAGVLSGRQLRRAVQTLVRGEVRPQLRAIDRQVGQESQVGDEIARRITDYYKGLQGANAGAVAGQEQSNAQLAAQLGVLDQQAQQAVQTSGQSALAALSQNRGPGLTGGAEELIARELAAGAGRVAAQGQTIRSTAALQGAGATTGLREAGLAAGMRGGEDLTDIGNRTRASISELLGRRADVQASRGPLHTKLLLQLREAGFEQLATQLGLGLEREQLQAEIAQDVRQTRTQRRGQNITRRGQDIAARTQRRGQNITRRGQDVSARTQRRGQDVTRRGQDISAETQRRGQNISARQQALNRRLKRALDDDTGGGANRTEVERAVGSVRSGVYETPDGRNIPLVDLLKRDPDKWRPKIMAQLQARWGAKVAREAIKRLSRRRRRGGSILGSVQDAVEELLR